MFTRQIALVLVTVVACAACGDGSAAPAGSGAVAAAPASHASAGVVPGSHEDWCSEHAVPESACSRCDASLVAAFKATGDWCGEHGLPESQCLKCNPTLVISRPAKDGG